MRNLWPLSLFKSTTTVRRKKQNPFLSRSRGDTIRNVWPILKRITLYIFLTGATILMSFPLFWMISTSLKTLEEANSPGIVWIPRQPTLDAYINIFQNADFLRSYFNTVFYTALALVGTLLSIAVVAYAFSRIEWPGRDVVFFLMLSTMMIPPQALIVPQYVFFNKLDWIGTFNPLIIPPPDIARPIQERQPGGLGIFLVKKLAHDIRYRREGDTNFLVMRKRAAFA